MRPRMIVAALAALAGCSPGLDPDLAKPCGERGNPALVLGTGQFSFIDVSTMGLPIETDLANGDYVWMGIACRGMGPDVNVDFGIRDDLTGAILSNTPETGVTLSYDSTPYLDYAPDRAGGLPAYFQLPTLEISNVAELIGRQVTLYANVVDECTALDAQAQTILSGYDELTCAGCLDGQCSAQRAECGLECVALQACLDAWCSHLSKISSPDEVTCQIACEAAHPAGKEPLIKLVECIQNTTCQAAPVDCNPTPSITCQAPCYGYSVDYRHCINLLDDPGNACSEAQAICDASPACVAYKACTSSCSTWAECQACAPDCVPICAGDGGVSPDGGVSTACAACNAEQEGEALYEAHQLCLETTCLPEIWLPHINSTSSLE